MTLDPTCVFLMEEGEQKYKVGEYPLTVSRTARASPSAADQSSGVKEEEEDDYVVSKEPGSGSVGPPYSGAATTHSRCYFESDALALKNNPEWVLTSTSIFINKKHPSLSLSPPSPSPVIDSFSRHLLFWRLRKCRPSVCVCVCVCV